MNWGQSTGNPRLVRTRTVTRKTRNHARILCSTILTYCYRPTKRARRAQPPSASQPLPATPSYKTPTIVKIEPSSTIKSKGKQKTVARKRSENFWHLDGSVVVQVQNTLFRLHRSRLTQQSEYFAALQNGDGRCVVMVDDVNDPMCQRVLLAVGTVLRSSTGTLSTVAPSTSLRT